MPDTIRRAPAMFAVLGLAAFMLAACGSDDEDSFPSPSPTQSPPPGGSDPSRPSSPGGSDPSQPQSPGGSDPSQPPSPRSGSMMITPSDGPAVTVKSDYREAGSETRGVVPVSVRDGGAGWSSDPLDSYFNFPDNTQLRFAVGTSTGAVATATIRDSRLVVGAFASSGSVEVTATGAGGTASLTFRFAVGPEEEPDGGSNGGSNRESNSAPTITNPGNESYTQRATITAFAIAVSDPESDALTVGVSGLPDGLTYSQTTGMVSGTVAANAAAQAYTVTVTANDGVNDPVTATFTITVTANAAPQISVPAARSPYDFQWADRAAAITTFTITVSDTESDPLTVRVAGLPTGLTYSQTSGGVEVSGTVSATAAVQLYTVTVTANDGIGDATRDFGLRVFHRILYSAGNTIQSPWGPLGTASTVSEMAAQQSARSAFNGSPPSGWSSADSSTTVTSEVTTAARAACSGMTPSLQLFARSIFAGSIDWIYDTDAAPSATEWQFRARRQHTWSARCQ